MTEPLKLWRNGLVVELCPCAECGGDVGYLGSSEMQTHLLCRECGVAFMQSATNSAPPGSNPPEDCL